MAFGWAWLVAVNPTSPKVIAKTHSFAIDPLFRKAAEGFDGHNEDRHGHEYDNADNHQDYLPDHVHCRSGNVRLCFGMAVRVFPDDVIGKKFGGKAGAEADSRQPEPCLPDPGENLVSGTGAGKFIAVRISGPDIQADKSQDKEHHYECKVPGGLVAL